MKCKTCEKIEKILNHVKFHHEGGGLEHAQYCACREARDMGEVSYKVETIYSSKGGCWERKRMWCGECGGEVGEFLLE